MLATVRCSAIVFDFDGTLADSMPFLERIGVRVMMDYYGVSKEEATRRYRMTTGLPYEHQVELNFPGHPANRRAVEEFEALKLQCIYEQELFPDAEATVRALRRMGMQLFVSSSTFQPTIEEYFRRRGLLDCFDEVVGYRPGFEKGAHHFMHIQRVHGVDLSDAVFVGDSLKDYERSVGFCRFIAVARMFGEDDFRRVGHTGPVVHSLSEVLTVVIPSH